jgi:hypothetical protein
MFAAYERDRAWTFILTRQKRNGTVVLVYVCVKQSVLKENWFANEEDFNLLAGYGSQAVVC